jgi:hypothetical protein
MNRKDAFPCNVTITIHVSDDLWNACKIQDMSKFPKENEVLFPPWSAFEVINSETNGGVGKLELRAWDNMAAMSDDAFNMECVTFKSQHDSDDRASVSDTEGLSQYQVTWTCGGGLNYRITPDRAASIPSPDHKIVVI